MNSELTQTEKFRLIVTKAQENMHFYKPSYHILRMYKDLGQILEGKEKAVELMTTYIQANFDTLETAQLVDWDETQPVLMYFLDENSLDDIFSYFESIIVLQNRRMIFYKEMMSEAMSMIPK